MLYNSSNHEAILHFIVRKTFPQYLVIVQLLSINVLIEHFALSLLPPPPVECTNTSTSHSTTTTNHTSPISYLPSSSSPPPLWNTFTFSQDFITLLGWISEGEGSLHHLSSQSSSYFFSEYRNGIAPSQLPLLPLSLSNVFHHFVLLLNHHIKTNL